MAAKPTRPSGLLGQAGRGAAWLLTFPSSRRAIGGTFKRIYESGRLAADSARQAFTPADQDSVPARSFKDYVQRHGLDRKELDRRHLHAVLIGRFCLLLLLLTVAAIGWFAITGRWFSAMLALSCGLLASAKFTEASVAAYGFRTRRLPNFADWRRSPALWWPR